MLISPALADTAVYEQASITTSIIPQVSLFAVFIALFFFLIWRPQAKHQQEMKTLIESLRVGDVIFTSGGIVGSIIQLETNFCKLSLAPNVQVTIKKEAITGIAPQGSLRTLGFE